MNKEMQLLNDFKLYLQDKSNIAFCTKFYTEEYELFTIDDVVNAIEKIQDQLEERDKVIDELKSFLKEFHNYENRFKWCEEDYIKTILKFEEILERGKNEQR